MGNVTQHVVPASSAEVFEIAEGQTFRIVAHEGEQVCDAVFLNADDPDEEYSSDMTVLLNQILEIGGLWQVRRLYSRPPETSLMLTVTEDRIKHHWPWAGGMCNSLLYSIRDGNPDHPSCADNLHAALAEYGIERSKVPEVFNIGMNVAIEDGRIVYKRPEFTKGDFIELRAEMDLIAAISACPNDTTVMNLFEPKPLRVDIDE